MDLKNQRIYYNILVLVLAIAIIAVYTEVDFRDTYIDMTMAISITAILLISLRILTISKVIKGKPKEKGMSSIENI